MDEYLTKQVYNILTNACLPWFWHLQSGEVDDYMLKIGRVSSTHWTGWLKFDFNGTFSRQETNKLKSSVQRVSAFRK